MLNETADKNLFDVSQYKDVEEIIYQSQIPEIPLRILRMGSKVPNFANLWYAGEYAASSREYWDREVDRVYDFICKDLLPNIVALRQTEICIGRSFMFSFFPANDVHRQLRTLSPCTDNIT
eukprot:Awhi_evm1s10902